MDSDERSVEGQDSSSVDSNGSQSSENQSDLSLSCSTSPFGSRHSETSLDEEAEGIEPYMYEPLASGSEDPVESDDSEDVSRLDSTDW